MPGEPEDALKTFTPTQEALDAMRAERDRFAFEVSDLQSKIGHLKDMVRGEQQAKEKALHDLEVSNEAWRTSRHTKDALTTMATTKDGVMAIVRDFLPSLTDHERETFFYEIERGYCGSCGRMLRSEDSFCQCTNDE